MIRSNLSKHISLLTVLVLLLHVVMQSAGWWSAQLIAAEDGSECCGSEYCCCDEAGAETCACSISEMPQKQEMPDKLFCGIKTNDRENESENASVIIEWMDIKALVQSSQHIYRSGDLRVFLNRTDHYQEIIPDPASPPPQI